MKLAYMYNFLFSFYELFRSSNDYITYKSVFLAVKESVRWLNNGSCLHIFVIPTNHKWSIIVHMH
jgi:hypothetical protein